MSDSGNIFSFNKKEIANYLVTNHKDSGIYLSLDLLFICERNVLSGSYFVDLSP